MGDCRVPWRTVTQDAGPGRMDALQHVVGGRRLLGGEGGEGPSGADGTASGKSLRWAAVVALPCSLGTAACH